MAQINIKGIIGTDYTYAQLLTDFASCGQEMIDLYVDSPGGDVEQGNAMADFVQSKSDRFNSVRNSGDVASIAAPIFLALPYEKRFYDPSKGVALIHNPYIDPESFVNVDTTSAGLAIASSILMEEEIKMEKFISKQTGVDVDVISEFMKINEPLSVEQLKAIRFAQIIEYKAVAFFKPNQKIDKMNVEDVEKIIDKKQESLLDKLKALFAPKAVAMMMTDATGAMIEFPDVAEGMEPKEGDTAKLETGVAVPDGDIVMADGRTFTFVGSKLTGIADPIEEVAVPNAELEAKDAKIAELEALLAAKAQTEIALRAKIKSQMIGFNPEEGKETASDKKSAWAELREKVTN